MRHRYSTTAPERALSKICSGVALIRLDNTLILLSDLSLDRFVPVTRWWLQNIKMDIQHHILKGKPIDKYPP